MSRTILIFALIATGALCALGCDSGGAKSANGVSANGLGGDTDAGTEAATTEEATTSSDTAPVVETIAPPDEGPPVELEVTWTDAADTEAVSKLAFTVKNVSDAELSFTVFVDADGIVGKAKKDVGSATLAVGESAEFEINASQIPVRSHVAVNELSVKLVHTVATPYGTQDVTESFATRMYRHISGYGTVRTYTSETLESELGGFILPAPAAKGLGKAAVVTAETVAAEVIGEIADGAGGFNDVTKEEAGLADTGETSGAAGYTISVKRGQIAAEELESMEAILAAAAAATASESVEEVE